MKKALAYLLENVSGGGKPNDILVVIKNYTGDLINFKSAIASVNVACEGKARVAALCVGDDVTFLGDDDAEDADVGEAKGRRRPPPRGLAGCVLLYKILGALAIGGDVQGDALGLDALHARGEDILSRMWTLGVSLGETSLPRGRAGAGGGGGGGEDKDGGGRGSNGLSEDDAE